MLPVLPMLFPEVVSIEGAKDEARNNGAGMVSIGWYATREGLKMIRQYALDRELAPEI